MKYSLGGLGLAVGDLMLLTPKSSNQSQKLTSNTGGDVSEVVSRLQNYYAGLEQLHFRICVENVLADETYNFCVTADHALKNKVMVKVSEGDSSPVLYSFESWQPNEESFVVVEVDETEVPPIMRQNKMPITDFKEWTLELAGEDHGCFMGVGFHWRTWVGPESIPVGTLVESLTEGVLTGKELYDGDVCDTIDLKVGSNKHRFWVNQIGQLRRWQTLRNDFMRDDVYTYRKEAQ